MASSNTTTKSTPLTTLTEWSQSRIKEVFEATSTESSKEAISRTFAKNVSATINGTPLTYEGLVGLVTLMRESSKAGLKVRWLQGVDVAQDPSTNRVRELLVLP